MTIYSCFATLLKMLQVICLSLLFVEGVMAQQLPVTVVDALKRAALPAYAVGIYVQETEGNQVLTSFNAKAPLNPASTMKLVTSNAALELLGPTFSWKTQAYATGSQVGNVLHGDLIIKGSGDPKLVIENFWLFLKRIRMKGIQEIRGNVVLDRSIFEEAAYDAAQFDGDPAKPYNVGPDPLLLNYKAFAFRFMPDATTGVVQVMLDPPMAHYPVVAPKLGDGECGDWRAKLKVAVDSTGSRFDGVFPASCGEKLWYLHPHQLTHGQYFALVFQRVWSDLGGTFNGEIKSGTVPASARLLTEWESSSLAEVIRDINKYSNNVMARQLLLTLAHHALQLPANPERGAAVIKTWLGSKRIDAPELVIENGSGLSRNERLSAETLGRLLVATFRSPLMPEFMASMPLVGYDGTMRQRLKTQSVAGHAHIKTGMLNNVRAIAGYVLAASGKRYAVVCIINHSNAARGQEAQDALLQWVFEQG